MSAPKLLHTFVILAYKESPYLQACVDSILAQTVPSEVIICTSTPNAYIQSMADKHGISVHVNTNGGSIGKDWNFGMRSAVTKYVTLAHQDDIYHADFAENCIALAEQNEASKPLMAFTRSLTYKGDKELSVSFKNIIRWLLIFPFHIKQCISSKSIKKSILLFSNSISCPGVFYVKQNLEGFQFNEEAKYILDWEAWYNMSQMDGAFIYVPHILHTHREYEGSATSSTQLTTLQQEEQWLLQRIWGNAAIAKLITKLLVLAK
jgi:glycosyltransferase involved in cell wall biosynthesis